MRDILSMKINLKSMTRHDERLDESDAGPIEYLLIKLSNLAFYRRRKYVNPSQQRYLAK